MTIQEAIAYFPLLVLISSALFSIAARKLSSRWGSKVAFSVAALMAMAAFLWLHFQPINSKDAIYGASILMGGGASMMLITALTMTSVMINRVDKVITKKYQITINNFVVLHGRAERYFVFECQK